MCSGSLRVLDCFFVELPLAREIRSEPIARADFFDRSLLDHSVTFLVSDPRWNIGPDRAVFSLQEERVRCVRHPRSREVGFDHSDRVPSSPPSNCVSTLVSGGLFWSASYF